MDYDKTLRTIARAWGKKQEDEFYCFFPWIDREEQAAADNRRAGFHDGPAFAWPSDRDKILKHMEAHTEHDLYWCPSLFETPVRQGNQAADERSLWADLDEADPRKIEDYPPTIAWETSPGRYQALWILSAGDIQGASWPGKENQRLTYHIGADISGWDTTQLLRVPGWQNHKPEYRSKSGNYPTGRLLWSNGRTYLPDEFEDLPEVEGALSASDLTDVVAQQVEALDVSTIMARIKLKLTPHARELIRARNATGDRSNALWDIERSLADAGCSVEEIVAIVRGTVWNKYRDRADELKRLITEATKAIAARPKDIEKKLQDDLEERPKAEPGRMAGILASMKKPTWVIDGILSEGAVGFIAGEPKSFKTWVAMDMAISVATGTRFLDYFTVRKPGPVLFIEEEDPGSLLKTRATKIWKSKAADKLKIEGKDLMWEPASAEGDFDPDINLYLHQGFIISDESWQEWLDDTLTRGMNSTPYRLLTIDTLMMVAGSVDENRSQDMTARVFRPLKSLARKHNIAIQVVHHMRKGGENGQRGGQRLLGSVANHAWADDSLFLTHGSTQSLMLQTESKNTEARQFRLDGIVHDPTHGWNPAISRGLQEDKYPEDKPKAKKPPTLTDKQQQLLDLVSTLGGTVTAKQIATELGFKNPGYMYTNLDALAKKGYLRPLDTTPKQWLIIA